MNARATRLKPKFGALLQTTASNSMSFSYLFATLSLIAFRNQMPLYSAWRYPLLGKTLYREGLETVVTTADITTMVMESTD